MKITKRQLKQIIKEELEVVLIEQPVPGAPPSQDGAYEWRTSIPPDPDQPVDEEAMESFVAKQFVGPAQHRMSMPAFNLALEKFEVEFNLDFPESVAKLHDILVGMGYPDLADGLRHLYGDDVDYGKNY